MCSNDILQGFYDPLSDTLIEPDHTGISYSFTSDGHFEEAYYRAIPNPVDPSCPEGMLQWQHGTYILVDKSTTSLDTTTNQRISSLTTHLILTPIDVDGRQLLSKPCDGDNALYMRYNQTETFKQFTVGLDEFHNVQKLNLFQWDGTPVQPMYLVYSPPQMLPTTTLNPTTASATATSGSKVKRGMGAEVPLNWKAKLGSKQNQQMVHHINADRLWWIGLGMTAVGGLLYLGPRRLGIQI